LIQAALGGRWWKHRLRAVFAPFSTVYREDREPQNAVVLGF